MSAEVDRVNLVAVADRLRLLLIAIAVTIASNAVCFLASFIPYAHTAFWLMLLAMWLASVVFGWIATMRLASSVHVHWLLFIFYATAVFLPVLGLLSMMLLSTRATAILRSSGVKVGFMGVGFSEYCTLRTWVCYGCGYSRQGLDPEAPCPECGRMPVAW